MKKLAFLLCLTTLFLSSCVSLRGADEEPDITVNHAGNTEPYTYTDNVKAEVEETEAPQIPIDKVEITDPYFNTDISFVAVGDNLIHGNIWKDAAQRATDGNKYDFLPMYEHLAPYVEAADVSFINQETIMAGEAYGITAWPTFNSPQELGLDLVTLGFDVINVATNHILDKGENGYRSTLDFWHSQPVTMIGGYYNEADHDNIRVTEAQGVKIAWLSYTYGTNAISLPYGSEMYVPYFYEDPYNFTGIKDELIKSDIAKAETLADITIVSIHWGNEYTHTPNADQKYIAQLMADSGVEVILGHHSHCLQPVEWIEGEGGNETLCIYSLGNIVSGQDSPIKLVGGIFSFRIVGDGNGGLKVVDPELNPTVMYFSGWNWWNTKVYPLDLYTDEIAATHTITSMTRAEAIRIAKGCIDAEFLPDYLK